MDTYLATEVAYRNGYDAGKQAAKEELLETLGDVQYYVIKNPDTGLYFRGKGVNRWGKYFNQASIYKVKGSAEFSAKEITQHNKEKAEVVPIKIIEEI